MNHIFRVAISSMLFVSSFLFISCKKEYSCEHCNTVQKPPIAIAGTDTIISLPNNSVILDGSSSYDPDGKIASFFWTKISGPSTFKLANPKAARTTAGSLIKGIYQFELKVTDADGLFDLDTVKITVNESVQSNGPPVANAGADQIIILPANSVNLDGSASSDPDNNIVSYSWAKFLGPSSFDINNVNTAKTQVTNLVEGVYRFELTVMDADGLFDKDTMQVEVKPQWNQQQLISVIFYWPEPVNTVPVDPTTGKQYWWQWWDLGSGFSGKIDLLTVKIDSLSGTIAGVWCKDCYTPTCSDFSSYYVDEPGTEHQLFQLPPGTYTWSAETFIKPFPYSYQNIPNTTPEFYNFFDTPHKTQGTITVNRGATCIIQKIVFQ